MARHLETCSFSRHHEIRLLLSTAAVYIMTFRARLFKTKVKRKYTQNSNSFFSSGEDHFVNTTYSYYCTLLMWMCLFMQSVSIDLLIGVILQRRFNTVSSSDYILQQQHSGWYDDDAAVISRADPFASKAAAIFTRCVVSSYILALNYIYAIVNLSYKRKHFKAPRWHLPRCVGVSAP